MELAWDAEIDTPATVAVIGGGCVGVEAALYARFLGYSVLLFDAQKVGHRQLAWGDHLIDLPWGHVTSSLGLAALEAQGTACALPADLARVSYREYVEKYLLPVARTDLLYDSVQINSPVISISRTGCGSPSSISIQRRAEQEFRVLVDSQQRGEYSQLVDIVLDCSGLSPQSGLASGGGLAIGETALRSNMQFGKVDVLGKHRDRYAGRHTLLFGRDLASCANAIDLAKLATQVEETRITWILPKQIGNKQPLDLPDNSSPELADAARNLLANNQRTVVCMPAWGIESLQYTEGWQLRLQTGEDETLDISGDELINCQRLVADWSFTAGLAEPLVNDTAILGDEPHYYVLGAKRQASHYSIAVGLTHIRRAFALIGGRADLDLYATIRRQNAT